MFLILIVLAISSLTLVRELRSDISNLSSYVQSLEFNQNRLLEEIWSLDEDVQSALYADANIQYIDYEVIDGIEGMTDVYDVRLTFALKEISIGNDISLIVESNTDIETYILNNSTSRQYVDLELNLEEDYIIYVEVDDGIEVIRNDIAPMNLYEYLLKRFSYYVEFDIEDKNAITNYYINNQWSNASSGLTEEGLKIKEVHVKIINNDVTIVDKVYTTVNFTSSHSETYTNQYIEDVGSNYSGTWQVIVTIIDEFGIEYDMSGQR
jgi:hypothetical protein